MFVFPMVKYWPIWASLSVPSPSDTSFTHMVSTIASLQRRCLQIWCFLLGLYFQFPAGYFALPKLLILPSIPAFPPFFLFQCRYNHFFSYPVSQWKCISRHLGFWMIDIQYSLCSAQIRPTGAGQWGVWRPKAWALCVCAITCDREVNLHQVWISMSI